MRFIELDSTLRNGNGAVCDAARPERVEAVLLRRNGATYSALQQRFGIAKSTLWRWLKAEGLVDTQSQQYTERRLLAQQKAAEVVHRRRIEKTQVIVTGAKQEIGTLTERELMMVGIALYWGEGSKQKPHSVSAGVAFSNSDPRAISVFLAWLQTICGVSLDDVILDLYIHETADGQSAQAFWSEQIGVSVEKLPIRWKRHKLTIHRKNIGTSYHGLVRVKVRRSTDLNRTIAGWIEGIVEGIGESANGKPRHFGCRYPGSIPGSPASCLARGRTPNTRESVRG